MAVVYSTDFTAASNAELSAYDAAWEQIASGGIFGTITVNATTDRAEVPFGGSIGTPVEAYYRLTGSGIPTGDQSITWDASANGHDENRIGLILRAASGGDCYLCDVYRWGGNNRIYRRISGVLTLLDSGGGNPDPSTTYELTATAEGTGAQVDIEFVGATSTRTYSDTSSDRLTSGTPGVHLRQGGFSPNAVWGDDLSADDMDAGGVEPVELAAESGSFAITGTDATLRAARQVDAEAGAVAVTGTDASLAIGRRVAAEVGAVEITGTDATLRAARSVTAEAGEVTVTGTDATLRADRTLSADPGSLVVTGTDAGLAASRTLSAEQGSVAVTGTDAGLRVGRRIDAESGAVAITGTDADLVYTPASGAFTLTADPGAVDVTGTDAALRAGRRIAADAGEFAITGTDAELRRAFTLLADAAAFEIIGQAADLIAARRIPADAGAVVVTGTDATLVWSGEEVATSLSGTASIAATLRGTVIIAPALSGTASVAASLTGTTSLEPL